MSTFAAPIQRGSFVYHDTFYADVGNLNRHPRASVAELNALLRPSNSSRSVVPAKDPYGHWYEAQLLHYGLPSSRNKNTAKVRLLNALNAGALLVPAPIQALEAQMKKEYDAANRKAKAAQMQSNDAGSTAENGKRKRKRDRSDGAGGNGFALSGTSVEATAKKTRGGASEVNVRICIGEAWSATEENKRIKKGSTAAKPNTPLSSAKSTPKKQQRTQSSAEPTSASSMSTYQRTNPSPTPRKPSAKPRIKREETPDLLEELKTITGVYIVECPTITSIWGADSSSMRLKLDHNIDDCITWGGFSLGPFEGVIQMSPGPAELPSTVTFGWRMRHEATGDIRFGRGCTGEIEFGTDRRFKAVFFNLYGDCLEFWGWRKAGPLWCGRSADSFRQEWDDFVTEAYGSREW